MSKRVPNIESYEFGRVVIDGRTYTADVIVTPGGVKADWWRNEGHSLYPEDLEGALTPDIEVVIIGCGANRILKVSEDTRRWRLVDVHSQTAGRIGAYLTCLIEPSEE